MAVQAQYPPNLLLLNRSVQQEVNNHHHLGNDYSMQPQPGGGFLDQTHMLFNSVTAGSNSRKRGREQQQQQLNTTSTPMNSMISMQQQQQQRQQQAHPQLIDLTQLHNSSHQNVVSTGLRLAFGDQQQQLQQQQQQTPQHSLSAQSPVVLSLLSDDLATEIKHQRDEIEQFILSQGEQLRRTLAEKRQRHYRALLGAAEESVARRLREKEVEVEKAARRHAELEARAAQLCAEAQAWRARATAGEATAAALQAQLQQAIMSAGGGGGVRLQDGDDCGEGCSPDAGVAEDAESAYTDPDRVTAASGPSCKACGKRVASVVLLPCRHLCVCTECDGVIQACPLCLSFRSSSVEVFLF